MLMLHRNSQTDACPTVLPVRLPHLVRCWASTILKWSRSNFLVEISAPNFYKVFQRDGGVEGVSSILFGC